VSQQHSHTAHDHGHHGHHGHEDHGNHGSLKDYTVGFVLSVILTAIPFWLVMNRVISNSNVAIFVLLGLAAVQIIVHMIYFLHMNTRAEGGWSLMALIFTAILLVIVLSGSIWVMFHMNANMMPAMGGMQHQM
jgi:cytochrome o ubiquinol oxidase operon protein cyoD